MEHYIKPVHDYFLARKVEKDSGVVTNSDIRDTHQLFEVLAVGEGRMIEGVLVPVPAQVGDIVWVQKHAAEGDTPVDLANVGLALILGSRIMAIDNGDKPKEAL